MATKLTKKLSKLSSGWDSGHKGSAVTESGSVESVFHDAEELVLHIDAHEEGGMAFQPREAVEHQRTAILELAKEVGRKLLMGHVNLTTLHLPVSMFAARSYLQKLADEFVHVQFLQRAAQERNPVERLKLVACWFVAGLQHVYEAGSNGTSGAWMKPFNPILGETWQANLPDGTQLYVEQISHHPPTSAFQMYGRGFMLHGSSNPEASWQGNAIKLQPKGFRELDFEDGGCITMVYPVQHMKGILYSSNLPRGEISGTATFADHAHHLTCELTFGKAEGKQHPTLHRTDAVHGMLARQSLSAESSLEPGQQSSVARRRPAKTKVSFGGLTSALTALTTSGGSADISPEEVLAECSGNWLTHLDWDTTRYWTLVEDQQVAWCSVPDPLPSDSCFRADLRALAAGQTEQAQALKQELEQAQRADAKARKGP